MAQQPVLWKKRVLVPFWVVRICIMLLIIVASAITLRAIDEYSDIIKPAIASVVVFMLFIVIVLLLDILAIVLFLRDALKPATFLTMNCVQTGFWAGVLIMDFVAIGQGASAVGIGFSIFVFLTFVGLLIYSIVGYRRAKKATQRGNYTPAHNPAAPTPAAYPQYPMPSHYQQDTAYTPQTGAPAELPQNQHLPPYRNGGADGYYHQLEAKPANMV
ncbi:hypothetical protein ACN47E_003846 [Coniothyrium glycines]